MTGPGFLVALQQFLRLRTERRNLLALDELATLYEFVEFCAAVDAVEDYVVEGRGDPARLLDAARMTREETSE